jgi:hypothetical protein
MSVARECWMRQLLSKHIRYHLPSRQLQERDVFRVNHFLLKDQVAKMTKCFIPGRCFQLDATMIGLCEKRPAELTAVIMSGRGEI